LAKVCYNNIKERKGDSMLNIPNADKAREMCYKRKVDDTKKRVYEWNYKLVELGIEKAISQRQNPTVILIGNQYKSDNKRDMILKQGSLNEQEMFFMIQTIIKDLEMNGYKTEYKKEEWKDTYSLTIKW
jgi:hypothetical protein